MQYALLIYGRARPSDAEDLSAEMAGYDAFTEHVARAGALKAGEALHPIATATTVRVRDGHTVTTDGPFAETKEMLGGFYLVDAADLDEAIGYAAMIPGRRPAPSRSGRSWTGAAPEAAAARPELAPGRRGR